MFSGMNPFHSKTSVLAGIILAVVFSCSAQIPEATKAQARRLILKDGTYQSVTKYEAHGDRIRYFSAERGEWEEIPKALIDWDATDKFEQGREQGKLAPEAVELDQQLEAERKAEQARSPQVAPGLRLPDEGGIFLLETYQDQPQLSELQQSGADLDKSTKTNILRSAINPLAGVKQAIELPEAHAKIQSHTGVPSIYVNFDLNGGGNNGAAALVSTAEPPSVPLAERYKIIRVQSKNGKRVAGNVKIAVTGKMKTDERYIMATVTTMAGGWVKLTPTDPLPNGEYAVAEILGKDGMNLYVWDFGVNPSAPANQSAWKPDPKETQPTGTQQKTVKPPDLLKRDSQ